MKKLVSFIGMALIACAGFAADANQMSYIPVLAPVAGITNQTAVLSAAADTLGYKGNCSFVAYTSAMVTNVVATNTVTLYTCATSDGTYQTVTNIAGTAAVLQFQFVGGVTEKVKTYPIGTDRLLRYIKAGYAVSGDDNQTNVTASAILVAPYKTR